MPRPRSAIVPLLAWTVALATLLCAVAVSASFAAPSDTNPRAVDDAYVMVQDTTLPVDPPGVLMNDIEPDDGYTIWVNWHDRPAHGSIRLSADGSFEYAPAAGWSGVDRLHYTLLDGSGRRSEQATVTLTVLARASLSGPGGTRVLDYPVRSTVTGTLRISGSPAEGLPVHLLVSENNVNWSDRGAVATTTADGRYSFSVRPEQNTWYRAVFYGDEVRSGAKAPLSKIEVRPWVGVPHAPTDVKRNQIFTIYGDLRPFHTPGDAWVFLNLWRRTSSGSWKPYGSSFFTLSSAYRDSSGSPQTRYWRRLRLPSKGRYRVGAYAPLDFSWAPAVAKGYDYVTVK